MTATSHLAAQNGSLAQRERALRAGARHVGWKIGHAIAEVEAVQGATPAVGWLTSATLLRDGMTYAAGHPAQLRAETELVVQLGTDVAAGVEPDGAAAAVAGIGVALELVDVARPAGGLAAIIAGNVFHRAAVLGPCTGDPDATVGDAVLFVGDRRHAADEPPPDVGALLAQLAAALADVGQRLRAGDRVLTGSMVHVPVAIGDRVAAEIAGLGRVGAVIGR